MTVTVYALPDAEMLALSLEVGIPLGDHFAFVVQLPLPAIHAY